jgi:hypothetical protein
MALVGALGATTLSLANQKTDQAPENQLKQLSLEQLGASADGKRYAEFRE